MKAKLATPKHAKKKKRLSIYISRCMCVSFSPVRRSRAIPEPTPFSPPKNSRVSFTVMSGRSGSVWGQ